MFPESWIKPALGVCGNGIDVFHEIAYQIGVAGEKPGVADYGGCFLEISEILEDETLFEELFIHAESLCVEVSGFSCL